MDTPERLFCVYAPADHTLCGEFEKHLIALKQRGVIDCWHVGRLVPGEDREQLFNQHLLEATCIVLLLSSDFMNSSECVAAMELALVREAASAAIVIPLLLRPLDQSGLPLGRLQSLPRNGNPVMSWTSREEAWVGVVRELRLSIEKRRKERLLRRPSRRAWITKKASASAAKDRSRALHRREFLTAACLTGAGVILGAGASLSLSTRRSVIEQRSEEALDQALKDERSQIIKRLIEEFHHSTGHALVYKYVVGFVPALRVAVAGDS